MCSDAFPSRLAATLALALIAVWPRAALSAETPAPVAVPASAPTPEASATAAPTDVASIAAPAIAAPTDNPTGAKTVDASKAASAEATQLQPIPVESTQTHTAATAATPDSATPAEAEAAPVDVIAPVDAASSVDAAAVEAASIEAAAQQAAAEALAAAEAARARAEAAETAAAAAEAAAAQAISDAVDAAMSAAPRASTPAPAAPAKTLSKRRQQAPASVAPSAARPAAAEPAAAEPAAAEPAAIPLIEDTNAPPPTPSAVEATPAAPSIPTANQPAPPASADPVLAAPAVAAPAARVPPTPRALGLPLPPGEYIAAAGAGRLDIVAVAPAAPAAPARRRDAAPPPAALDFTLRSFGSNGHVCALEGRIVDGSAQLPTGDGVPACIVSFVATQTGVQAIDDSRTCRYFCGSHASFEGIYLRPAPGCDDAGRAATRGLFQTLYAAGDLPRAQARLSGLLEHCDNTLHWLERAQIANDLARIHARLGRREDCLQTLAPMSRDAALDDASLGEGFLPEDAAAYLPQVRAARDTLRRCRALPVAGAARAQSNPLTGMPADIPVDIPADLPADKPDPAHVGGGQR